jgi:hypothetical protein
MRSTRLTPRKSPTASQNANRSELREGLAIETVRLCKLYGLLPVA